jgi:predicted protein tyrosine phosphatase
MKKKVLFVCTSNRHRSPTAESLLARHPLYEARSAGISPLSERVVTRELLEWADVVFVMDEEFDQHRRCLLEMFPDVEGLTEKIIVLGIPDIYERDDPELVGHLREKLARYLPDRDVGWR